MERVFRSLKSEWLPKGGYGDCHAVRDKSVDKCLLQRLSTSYKQWWFIALPHEEKWKQVIPVS